MLMLVLMFFISLKTQIKQITYLMVESLGMINIFICIFNNNINFISVK
jgi:hypothetical protein